MSVASYSPWNSHGSGVHPLLVEETSLPSFPLPCERTQRVWRVPPAKKDELPGVVGHPLDSPGHFAAVHPNLCGLEEGCQNCGGVELFP